MYFEPENVYCIPSEGGCCHYEFVSGSRMRTHVVNLLQRVGLDMSALERYPRCFLVVSALELGWLELWR